MTACGRHVSPVVAAVLVVRVLNRAKQVCYKENRLLSREIEMYLFSYNKRKELVEYHSFFRSPAYHYGEARIRIQVLFTFFTGSGSLLIAWPD